MEYYEAEKARKEKIRQKKSAKEMKDAKDAARRLAEEEFKTKLSSSSRFQQMLAEREAVRQCPGRCLLSHASSLHVVVFMHVSAILGHHVEWPCVSNLAVRRRSGSARRKLTRCRYGCLASQLVCASAQRVGGWMGV